jgi:hypothetical protein
MDVDIQDFTAECIKIIDDAIAARKTEARIRFDSSRPMRCLNYRQIDRVYNGLAARYITLPELVEVSFEGFDEGSAVIIHKPPLQLTTSSGEDEQLTPEVSSSVTQVVNHIGSKDWEPETFPGFLYEEKVAFSGTLDLDGHFHWTSHTPPLQQPPTQ